MHVTKRYGGENRQLCNNTHGRIIELQLKGPERPEISEAPTQIGTKSLSIGRLPRQFRQTLACNVVIKLEL